MKNIIKKVVASYKGNGFLEVNTEKREFTTVEYVGKELENLTRANVFVGSIRIYEKGFWYFISFMDNDLEKHFNTITDMVKAGEGKKGGLTPYKSVVDKVVMKCEKDPRSITLEEKHDLIKKYNDIIINNKSMQTSRSLYRDLVSNRIYANSENSFIEMEKAHCGISCSAFAKDGMNVQKASFSHAGTGGFEFAVNHEQNVENTIKDVIDMLNSPQIDGGRYNVILDNHICGVFAHEAFGHLSEADFIYENPGLQEMMKKGRQFGKENLNIVDDGSIEKLGGYTPYDDEGVPTGRTELIKNGILNARLTSRETAYKLSEPLSGNARFLSPYFSPLVRMTNTFIDKGETSVEDLFSKCEDGIYAKGFIGGMTSLEQFTFTPRCAYIIKNGKIKSPVRDVVLSGNVFDTLKSISAIGNDLVHHSTLGGCGKFGQTGLTVSTGGPHLLIDNVLVGGK